MATWWSPPPRILRLLARRMFALPTEPLRSSPRRFRRLGPLSTRIGSSRNIEGRRARRLAAPAPTLSDPNLTLTRTQYPATVSNTRNRKPVFYAGFANPCKTLSNHRPRTRNEQGSGSSPLVGSLPCANSPKGGTHCVVQLHVARLLFCRSSFVILLSIVLATKKEHRTWSKA